MVNDGSTDNSLAVAKNLSASHPQITMISQKYGEVSTALNTGCNASFGSYLFPSGADEKKQEPTRRSGSELPISM